MSFDQDPNEQAQISGADLVMMVVEMKAKDVLIATLSSAVKQWKANHAHIAHHVAMLSQSQVPPVNLVPVYKAAARYQWLREQQWNSSDVFVVSGSKSEIQLGTYCPSLDLLDAEIDEKMTSQYQVK